MSVLISQQHKAAFLDRLLHLFLLQSRQSRWQDSSAPGRAYSRIDDVLILYLDRNVEAVRQRSP